MTKVQQARPTITWALLGFAILVAFAALILVPVWLEPPLSKADLSGVPAGESQVTLQQAQAQLQNSIRSTLLQGLGGVLVIGGALGTWRQVRISREGQITDRLTHAMDQLGSDKVDVRIGGIYALERLAKDSAADRLTIVEILAAFIRTHAAWPAGHHSHPGQHPTPEVDETMLWLTDRAPDVRTAVLVLGRYPHEWREYRLPLRRVDLRRTNFYHGALIKVDLGASNLAGSAAVGVRWEKCRFWNTDLRKTQLREAILDQSEFIGAHLEGTNLPSASLRKADLTDESMRGVNLRDANLRDANLTRADLSGADLSGADLTGAILLDAQLADVRADHGTMWPAGFTA